MVLTYLCTGTIIIQWKEVHNITFSRQYILASEWSKRDTLRGNTIENRGYLLIYMCECTYVILYFDPPIFLC